MEKETRVYRLSGLTKRQATGDEPAVLKGLAAVYNVESEDLGGFVEEIEPGFFNEVIDGDIRAVQNHDPNRILGRTTSRTLFLTDTNEGLEVLCIPPDTTYANDLMQVMERGDIDQMSFRFAVKKEGGARWERTVDGIPKRILQRNGCSLLDDIAFVTYPAYPQTSASVIKEARALMTETDGIDGQASTDQSDNDTAEGNRGQARRLPRAKNKINLAIRK